MVPTNKTINYIFNEYLNNCAIQGIHDKKKQTLALLKLTFLLNKTKVFN